MIFTGRVTFDYSAMRETSERMNEVLKEPISVQMIQRFVEVGLMLLNSGCWEGPPAERFAHELNRIKSAEVFDESALRWVANYPRICADKMEETQREVAAKVRAILGG